MRKLLFLFAVFLYSFQLFAQKGKTDLKKLQAEVQRTVRQVYQASVAITRYDAMKGNSWGGTFSGVVIDTAGHILSVAHAVSPGTLYEILFPDGKKMLARGLGRIAGNDAAMLKINEKGKWPYAAMGWSSSLQKDMPCISISYPNVVGAKTPTVRLGYIAETETKGGFIRSTCLMEPGDSGGPLFDLMGRVIGLHSKIDMPLDANFEVPVDLYRKYWVALTQTDNYVNVPAESPVGSDPDAGALKVFPRIQELSSGLDKARSDKMKGACLKLKSPYKGRKLEANVLGTLINIDGLMGKSASRNKSFLISKSSMLSDVVKVELGPDRMVAAKVISRDVATDLALLQIDEQIKGGVDLNAFSVDAIRFSDLGTLLASPRPGLTATMSVISNTPLSIPKVKSDAYIGLSVNSVGGKLLVAGVQEGGPAGRASVYRGDELLSINGKTLGTEQDLNEEIERYVSNDTVSLQVLRDGKQFEKRVAVRIRAQSAEEMHIAYHFADGRSDRRSDFSNVMIHDARLKPVECGGPVYGIDGKFYGINIARFSRTSSLAIPLVTIHEFVKNAMLPKNN